MQYKEQYSSNTMTTNSNTIIPQGSQEYNYNNNISHGTGRFMTPEQCEAIKTAYLENISDSMTGAVARMIETAFKSGLEANEIVMAIEETGFAPKPTPWYLKKILENWAESGCIMSKINRELSHPNYQVKPWWK